MCIIYLLAGIFSAVVSAAGGVTSTVNFALSFIPVHLAVMGLFLMGCFISISMGTSCGTIAALAPIAVDISQKPATKWLCASVRLSAVLCSVITFP